MLVCLLAISAGFVSCSDDDESVDGSSLVGTWEATRYEGYYYVGDGERVDYEEPGDGLRVTFNADGTGTDGEDSFEWSLSGNSLRIAYDGDVEISTVTRLTATELVTEWTERGEYGEYLDRTYFRRVN